MGPLPHRRLVSAYRLKFPSFLLVKLDTPSISFREKLAALILLLISLVEYVWSKTMNYERP